MNKVKVPQSLTPILVIASWMTYRILGFIFMPSIEVFGGDILPTAWIIPLGQDALIGLSAPFIVYLLATRPSILSYALGVAWLWWGIADFGVGLATEIFQPPLKSPFGPHTPNAMLTGWLLINLTLELYAFFLFLKPEVRNYFVVSNDEVPLSIKETPWGGRWVWVIIIAVLNGLLFPFMANGIDAAFQMMGF